MANGEAYRPLVENIFKQLDRQGPDNLPRAGALAEKLRKRINEDGDEFHLRAPDAALFGSASVEMWLKAVHSFLVSASVMKTSPVWSAVAGYYSSHYTMRAFSHVFGRFLLGRDRKTVEIVPNAGYRCEAAKRSNLLEHQYYWELPHKEFGVKGNATFSLNPPIKRDTDISDGFHRIYANYFDHVYRFQDFTPLDETFLRARVERVSEIVTDSPTTPDNSKFPDLDAVHVIAYARIVKFRSFLDNVVDPANRCWKKFRHPSWFVKYMDFQVLESNTLTGGNIPT